MKSSKEFKSSPRRLTPAGVMPSMAPQYFSRGWLSVTSTIAPAAKIPLVAKWGFDFVSEYQKEVDRLSFHPSSKFLLGANHGSVKLWDVSNGELVCETTEGRDPAQFSRDGRLLATVGKDKKTVLLWEMVSN